jgi:hypothetical protein
MKKAFLLLGIGVLGLVSFGQSVHKGSLLGLHSFTPTLKPGVTMKQYKEFYTSTVIPEFGKAFPDVKVYLLTSVRGQDSSGMGVVYVFDSEAVRNKYFNNDGSMSAAGVAANDKLGELRKKMESYEESSDTPDK